jgi:hypothetical protein
LEFAVRLRDGIAGWLDLILDLKRTEQNCADKSKRRAGREYIHPQG